MYAIEFVPSAAREMTKLPPDVRPRIARAIDRLRADPHPPSARVLKGDLSGCRIRVGDYRILYQVDDMSRVVVIGRIAQRGRVYR